MNNVHEELYDNQCLDKSSPKLQNMRLLFLRIVNISPMVNDLMKELKKKIGYENSALLPRKGKVERDIKVKPRWLSARIS